MHKTLILWSRLSGHAVCCACLPLPCQEACIIQENVEKWPTAVLEQYLGDLYHIDEIVLRSTDYAFPGSRKRKYCILSHKVKTVFTRFPLDQFSKALQRQGSLDWRRCFIADSIARKDELTLGVRRKVLRERVGQKPAQELTTTEKSAYKTETEELIQRAVQEFDYDHPSAFESLLPPWEASNLAAYRLKFPSCAYSLNQSATSHPWERNTLYDTIVGGEPHCFQLLVCLDACPSEYGLTATHPHNTMTRVLGRLGLDLGLAV